ncbi:hypothetical protein H2201_008995, partial [Coniosporium apollinis]
MVSQPAVYEAPDTRGTDVTESVPSSPPRLPWALRSARTPAVRIPTPLTESQDYEDTETDLPSSIPSIDYSYHVESHSENPSASTSTGEERNEHRTFVPDDREMFYKAAMKVLAST